MCTQHEEVHVEIRDYLWGELARPSTGMLFGVKSVDTRWRQRSRFYSSNFCQRRSTAKLSDIFGFEKLHKSRPWKVCLAPWASGKIIATAQVGPLTIRLLRFSRSPSSGAIQGVVAFVDSLAEYVTRVFALFLEIGEVLRLRKKLTVMGGHRDTRNSVAPHTKIPEVISVWKR